MIIENKLQWIVIISVILFFMYTFTFLVNTSTETMELENISNENVDNYSYYTENQGVDILGFLGTLISTIFLQIDGAPAIVNLFTGFISGILLFSLIFILVAYAREMIGFT